MNKYNGLLLQVSNQYHICKGDQETESNWKTRLVYSICGMMAYASLWDNAEAPISVVHLKGKVRSVLANYKSMYPELADKLPYVSEEFEDEIASQFLNTGVVYHRPNRIVPSMMHEELFDNILYQRGLALDHISCISGIGFYANQAGETNPEGIKTMFSLEQDNLQTVWYIALSTASWKASPVFGYSTEYLRLEPPFSRGYWVNKPDKTGVVSLLRTGQKGSQLYYLYRYVKTELEISPLPQWQVEHYQYRTLACACLSAYGTLPPIEYCEDGALVHIRLNYLLPPHELEFLKLYSWPEACTSFPCNFRRKISMEIFTSIQNILSSEGYELNRGTI